MVGSRRIKAQSESDVCVCVCVVDTFAQIDCDVVHSAIIRVFLCFLVCFCMCVAPNAAALLGFCNALLHFLEDYMFIGVCVCLINQRYESVHVYMYECVSCRWSFPVALL